jgi:uncharacterized protein YfaS (alpha-2-macroglobulin family)
LQASLGGQRLGSEPLPIDFTAPVKIKLEGSGPVSYRLGLKYSLQDTRSAARDAGFRVHRLYVGEHPGDITRDPQGCWHVKRGSLVTVSVNFDCPGPRFQIALSDPLAAGLEPARGQLSNGWPAHENLRDRVVEAFASKVEGQYSYCYEAEAVTSGSYTIPSARVEEMYHPETFGQSESDVMIIED